MTQTGERKPMKRTVIPALGIVFLVLPLSLSADGKEEKKPSKTRVTGTCTLDGKPVAGQVIFIDADGKEQPPAPINAQGKYFLETPPVGKYKVVIRPLAKPAAKAPKLPALPDAPKEGVPAPVK